MDYVVRVVGLVSGRSTVQGGQFLTRFDFEDCGPGECVLITTSSVVLARRFASIADAVELWQTVDPRDPVRADGRPNRPLTAYTVSVEPVEHVSGQS